MPRKPLADRFWSKVDKAGDCWNWTGSKNKKGYGSFRSDNGTKAAHRMSWVMAFGEVPSNLQVLHKCDNPSCVRPNHLFLGTNQDNRDDMMTKGRGSHAMGRAGEKHGSAVLTDAQVKEIKSIGRSEKGVVIAKRFGVSKGRVSSILTGRSWCSV